MKIRLPEKKYFSVAELAERWSVGKDDIKYLLDVGELPRAERLAALNGKRTVFLAYRPFQPQVNHTEFVSPPTDQDRELWNEFIRDDQFLLDVPFPYDGPMPPVDPCKLNMMGRKAAELVSQTRPRDFETVVLLGDVLSFEAKCAEGERQITTRERTSLLNIIGGLVELLVERRSPGGQRYAKFESQSALIEILLAHYENKPGMSKRNLEGVFPDAKKSLASSC
jgi:hypothetical protein